MKETNPIIIGSQSLHGKFPDVADTLLPSRKVDVILPNKSVMGKWLAQVVGDYTPYADDRGYFIDHVLPVEGLPVFSNGWKKRLIVHPLIINGVESGSASYLSPEDLVIGKLGAGREKDFVFLEALVKGGFVDLDTVQNLVAGVSSNYAEKVQAGLYKLRAYEKPDSDHHTEVEK